MRRRLYEDKQGMGLGDIWPVISLFGLIAIFLGIMIYVLASMLPSLAVANSTTNETNAYVNLSNYTMSDASACGYHAFVVTAVWQEYNDSLWSGSTAATPVGGYNVSIPASNYTYYSNGKITNATTIDVGNASISGTWTGGGRACQATNDVLTILINFIPWLGIILLVVAAAIVIGVLMGAFGGRRRV